MPRRLLTNRGKHALEDAYALFLDIDRILAGLSETGTIPPTRAQIASRMHQARLRAVQGREVILLAHPEASRPRRR